MCLNKSSDFKHVPLDVHSHPQSARVPFGLPLQTNQCKYEFISLCIE